MYLDTTGNLGIGTRGALSHKLELAGTASISGLLQLASSASISSNLEIGGYASVSSTIYLAGGSTSITGIASTSSVIIPNLEFGAMEFGANSGMVSWVDMPVTSVTRDTVEAYLAQLDGTPALSVFSKADGAGGIRQLRLGLGTSAPWAPFSLLASDSQSTTASTSFAIRSTATIGSVASISGTSLTAGGVMMQLTVPSSTSASAGYLVIRNSTGLSTYASLGYGGRLTLARDIRSDGATSNCTGTDTPSAGCIDFAESFPSADPSLVPGEIVAINPASASSVIKATAGNAMLGVVSTNPGILLTGIGVLSGSNTQREAPKHTVPVALVGRVPVKVSTENGSIEPGDHLTVSATIPGTAMKQTEAGMSIGTALEVLPDNRVMVFVNTSYWAPTGMQGILAMLLDQLKSLFSVTIENGLIQTIKGIFNEVRTDKLCIGETCVNEEQLKQLLQSQGMTPVPPAPVATPTPTPVVTPDVSPSVSPDASPITTPEITPDVTPDVTPALTPEITPTPEIPSEPIPIDDATILP
jgi:hypothetical protein